MTTFAHIPSPTCIARDEAGNLYVTSYKEGTVSKITPDAKVTVFARGLRTPFGVALDADNSVYVSAEYEGAIYRIMPGGGVTQKVVGGNERPPIPGLRPLETQVPRQHDADSGGHSHARRRRERGQAARGRDCT